MNPRPSIAAVVCSALVLVACGSAKDEKPAAGKGQRPGSTALFMHPKGFQGVLCPGAVQDDLGARISVRVWAPETLDERRILRHTYGLENALLHLGVAFESAGEVGNIEEGNLFVGAGSAGPEAIAKAEAASGPLAPEEKRALIAPLLAAPLRRHIERVSPGSNREVQVFFVDRIAGIDSPIAMGLNNAAGLTFSPFASADDDARAIEALVGRPLEELPAPLIFLSLTELGRMPMSTRVSTLAHEVGHAFGLTHESGRDNLMSPIRHGRCLPGLNKQQIAILEKNL